MAIVLKDTGARSELQQRIATELREKHAGKNSSAPDLVVPEYDDANSTYMEQTKVTTSLAWAWALIAVAVVGIIIAIMVVIS